MVLKYHITPGDNVDHGFGGVLGEGGSRREKEVFAFCVLRSLVKAVPHEAWEWTIPKRVHLWGLAVTTSLADSIWRVCEPDGQKIFFLLRKASQNLQPNIGPPAADADQNVFAGSFFLENH